MPKPALMDYDKALELFEPVLGFEVHVELSTETKMFSDAPNPARKNAPQDVGPNTQITPVDLGLPGCLPVVNEKAVEYAISLGLALGCEIASTSRFARKNYFYPDLAKDYQISQFDEPIAGVGSVDVELDDGSIFTVPIERAHMEEDAGKLTHVGGSTGRIQGAEYSLVDYNRAGVPLVEIVTQMILGAEERAPEVAKAYVATIRDIVRALDRHGEDGAVVELDVDAAHPGDRLVELADLVVLRQVGVEVVLSCESARGGDLATEGQA